MHLLVRRSYCRAPMLLALLFSTACAGGYTRVAPPSAAEIPALEARYRRDAADAAVGLRLGAAYRAAGRAEEAAVVLQRVQEAFPTDPGAVLYLGLTYEDLGRYAEAIALYERYVEVGRVEEVKEDVAARIPMLRREQMRAAARDALAREAELTNAAPAPRTIAVFPFVFAGTDGSLAPLSRALADMVTTDLSQTDRLSVLERAQVQALIDEMALSESGLVDESTAARAGHLLAAGTVVQGRVDMPTEESVRLEALAVPVTAAGVPDGAGAVVEDELSRLFDAEKALVLGLFDDMGIELTDAERVAVNRRPTESLQALLAYGRGLQAMDAGNFEAAAEAFETAAAIDPGFAVATERAQSASRAADAAGTSTEAIAEVAQEEVPEPEAPESDFDEVTILTPDPGGRDAGSEILGTENGGSVEPSNTGFTVNIPRP